MTNPRSSGRTWRRGGWCGTFPTEMRSLLEATLPQPRLELRMVHRQSGLGSLGRPRFTALAESRGGKVAREAKALLPSAWLWAAGAASDRQIYYDECVRRAVRAHDPFLADAGRVDSEEAFTVLQPDRTESDAALARRAEVAVDDGI